MNRYWKLNIKASSIWNAFNVSWARQFYPIKKNFKSAIFISFVSNSADTNNQIIFNSLYKGGAEKFLAQCIKNKIIFENLVIKRLILSSVSGE